MKQSNSLVSIIMPAYNVGKYIAEAIQSVLEQTYRNWELLVINDGSSDNTEDVILSFNDERIRYFKQHNQGVSKARNLGLQQMKGQFFCFLDADDTFPNDSLLHRIELFNKYNDLTFVDGHVVTYNSIWSVIEKVCKPSFWGNPFDQIVKLRSNCLCAISWMIRVEPGKVYKFKTGWSHSEDMAFYLTVSADPGTKYGFVEAPVYKVRRRGGSAMTNYDGLANGYANLYNFIFKEVKKSSFGDKVYFKYKIIRIMVLSFLSKRQFGKAIGVAFRYLFI